MDSLATMKTGKEKQISYRSTPEIVARLDFAAARLAMMGETMGEAKLRTGHVVNAVAVWLGGMGDEELRAVVGPMLRRYEAYIGIESVDAGPDLGQSGREAIYVVNPAEGKTLDLNLDTDEDSQPRKSPKRPKSIRRPRS